MKYKDSAFSISERVDDLVSQMTIDEKLDLLDPDFSALDFEQLPDEMKKSLKSGKRGDPVRNKYLQKYMKEYTRLGIPYLTTSEALHGFMDPNGTIFPQALTIASAFDPKYAREMGRVIGAEALAAGIHEVWTPVCDLARDPRYGRTEETFGEDDYLAARYAEAVVEGVKEGGRGQVICELKHFTAYAAPLGGLNGSQFAMNRHDAYAFCNPVFKAGIDAGAFNVMESYNSIDGIPVAADRKLLTDLLRVDYKLPGFVRADMTALAWLNTMHMVATNLKEALYMSVKAGVDVQFADFTHDEYRTFYKELIDEGRLTHDDLDTSVKRVLNAIYSCGLFDKADPAPEEYLSIVNGDEHREAALEAARSSVVLLKNDGILPLKKERMKIALIGPNADKAIMGDYCVLPAHESISLMDGIKAVNPLAEIGFERGCSVLHSGLKPVQRWWTKHSPRPSIVNEHYGLTGEYFNNHDLSGEPVLTRFDPVINFRWIYEGPDPVVNSNAFSVRWSGTFRMEKGFDGRLGFMGDDSVRMWLGGEKIIDDWDGNRTKRIAEVHLDGTKEYDIIIEFKNDARGAIVMFGFDFGEETIESAVELAESSDIAILALGDSNMTSGENFDRTTLDLAGAQCELLEAVLATGKPTVLVLSTGRPVTLNWDDKRLCAVLQVGFNGERGGIAAAEALFGDINPSGRLPISYPKSVGQIPCHYSRLPAGGRLYVETDSAPQFPFGYGLSYTKFEYSNLKLSKELISSDEEVIVSFKVRNVGDVAGDVTPQMYITDLFTSIVWPRKQLRDFRRITLKPEEGTVVNFTVNYDKLKLLDADFNWVVEPGDFKIMIGDNSADIRLEAMLRVTKA